MEGPVPALVVMMEWRQLVDSAISVHSTTTTSTAAGAQVWVLTSTVWVPVPLEAGMGTCPLVWVPVPLLRAGLQTIHNHSPSLPAHLPQLYNLQGLLAKILHACMHILCL